MTYLAFLLFNFNPNKSTGRIPNFILRNSLQRRRPNLPLRCSDELIVMLLQLRRATQKPTTLSAVRAAGRNQPNNKLRHDLNQRFPIPPSDVLKRTRTREFLRRLLIPGADGSERRRRENVVQGESIDGENQVGFAGEKLVFNG